MTRLDEIKARCAAATKGPWIAHCSHIYDSNKAILFQAHNPGKTAKDHDIVANRDFVVEARTNVPWLLRVAEAAEWYVEVFSFNELSTARMGEGGWYELLQIHDQAWDDLKAVLEEVE